MVTEEGILISFSLTQFRNDIIPIFLISGGNVILVNEVQLLSPEREIDVND